TVGTPLDGSLPAGPLGTQAWRPAARSPTTSRRASGTPNTRRARPREPWTTSSGPSGQGQAQLLPGGSITSSGAPWGEAGLAPRQGRDTCPPHPPADRSGPAPN